MILHAINTITTCALLFGMYFMSKFISPIFFILIPFIILGFIYNSIFIWIINKSKTGCRKLDFFSTWGREKIRNNYNTYFDDKYIKPYKIIANTSILFPILFIATIITFLVIALNQ